MITTDYVVTGMTCEHCVSSVRSEVGELPGVTAVEVDLASGKVSVTSAAPLDFGQVRAAVDEAGYKVAEP
jgi:copper chaperone